MCNTSTEANLVNFIFVNRRNRAPQNLCTCRMFLGGSIAAATVQSLCAFLIGVPCLSQNDSPSDAILLNNLMFIQRVTTTTRSFVSSRAVSIEQN